MKRRIAFVLALSMMAMLCLSACKKNAGDTAHTHTFAEQYTYDAQNHWKTATCEHTAEKGELGAHQFGADQKCTVCGYLPVSLLVKADQDAQYTRTKPVSSILQLGFQYGQDTENVKWVRAQEKNIDSYTISGGNITVQLSASVDFVKYTTQITIPVNENTVGVETFLTKNAGDTCMLNGVVVGFAARGSNNEVILADKTTGKLVAVNKMGEGKLLYGGYVLSDIAVGDEVIVPVTLVQDAESATDANSKRIYAEYKGGTDYKAAVVSKNNPISPVGEVVEITNQAELEAFLSAGSRENNHYKVVKLKGKMHFVMDGTYENYNFWFTDKQATTKENILIDGIVPCFNDPSLFYTTGKSFSLMVFGEEHHAAISYTEPLTAEVEITAVFVGGNTSYGQFLILDSAGVVR